MPLTDLICRKTKSATKLRKLSDMGGLQLWIFPEPRGTRMWRFAYRFRGKQKLLALGKYPDISLLEARMKRDEAKTLLVQGIDPCHRKRMERIEREYSGDSFDILSTEYVEKLRREGRADTTIEKIEWMLGFAKPILGPMSMRSIQPIEILAVLRGVEGRGRYETARRLRSTIGAIFRYAVATARADADPTLPLKGAITTPKTKSYAAITDPKALGALLRAIDGFTGHKTTQVALQLMALLFSRPGELRAAKWTEFDLDNALWIIPAERTKMRRAHKKPLSRQSITLLRDMRNLTVSSEYVLHSVSSVRKPISENTMNASLRRLGYGQDEMTSHGFRATASTLLNESGLWNSDAIERELGHMEVSDVRRAYARGEHWAERVKMMQWWADNLDQLRIVGKILPTELKSA